MLAPDTLTDALVAAAPTVGALRELELEGSYQRGAPLLPRPVVLTADEHAALAHDTTRLFALLHELPDRMFDGDLARYARAVGLGAAEHEQVAATAHLRCTPMGRADFYRDAHGLRLLEFNVGNRMGGWDVGRLMDRALTDPVLAAFARRHDLVHDDPSGALLAELRSAAGHTSPVVGVLGAPAQMRPGEPYFPTVVAWMRGMGVDAVGGHLGLVEEHADGIHVEGRRVDVVYRMFDARDVRDDPGVRGPLAALVRAAGQERIALCSPLGPEATASKANLALLSDPAHHGALEPEQVALVERTVPWTRVVRDGTTVRDGEVVDLRPYLEAHRTELVLKPVLGFGGRGVVPGWAVDADHWSALLDAARDDMHVVQERVVPQTERFARWEDPSESDETALNWGALCVEDAYVGCLVRGMPLADGPVINQATGARETGVLRPA